MNLLPVIIKIVYYFSFLMCCYFQILSSFSIFLHKIARNPRICPWEVTPETCCMFSLGVLKYCLTPVSFSLLPSSSQSDVRQHRIRSAVVTYYTLRSATGSGERTGVNSICCVISVKLSQSQSQERGLQINK